jgi:hypothetical protein
MLLRKQTDLVLVVPDLFESGVGFGIKSLDLDLQGFDITTRFGQLILDLATQIRFRLPCPQQSLDHRACCLHIIVQGRQVQGFQHTIQITLVLVLVRGLLRLRPLADHAEQDLTI